MLIVFFLTCCSSIFFDDLLIKFLLFSCYVSNNDFLFFPLLALPSRFQIAAHFVLLSLSLRLNQTCISSTKWAKLCVVDMFANVCVVDMSVNRRRHLELIGKYRNHKTFQR